MENILNRRNMLKKATVATTLALTSANFNESMGAIETAGGTDLKGRINHSACRWCYSTVPFEELVKTAKGYGMGSIELTGPTEWEVLKKYGLTSAMGQPDKWPDGLGLTSCFNNCISASSKLLFRAFDARNCSFEVNASFSTLFFNEDFCR